MRRTILLLTGLLLSIVALGADSPKEYDDRTTVDPLEGTWRLVGHDNILTTYHSGTWTIDNGEGEPWRGTYRIDTTSKQPHLHRFYANGPYKGNTIKVIYQIDGDTLRIEGLSNFTFKRVK
jgi:uncharacterized protein (TIGR03067 family)